MNRQEAVRTIQELGGILSDNGLYVLRELLKNNGTDALRDGPLSDLAENLLDLERHQAEQLARYRVKS